MAAKADFTLAKEIKEKRLALGMSRAEMSRQFEIPVRTIEEWDSGKQAPVTWVCKLLLEKLESMMEDEEMIDYTGRTWGSLTEEEKDMLIKNATAVDGETGNSMTEDGECIIDLLYPFSVPGRVEDGEIFIADDAVIYNPVA